MRSTPVTLFRQGTVNRVPAAFSSAAVVATVLVALAFLVAPHACSGGFEFYFWFGVAALLLLLGLPFLAHGGRSVWVRVALALGFLIFGAAAWLVGMFVANVRFICALGYL